jgi:glycosyltransferase involved in cell wall biosynthesis
MAMRSGYLERLVPEAPTPGIEACVIIPAKNEEELLPSALQALAEQKTLDGLPLSHERYEVLLLINNSSDRSIQIAKSFQRLYPGFQLQIIERNFRNADAHVGHVRRLLMDEACVRLEAACSSNGNILSTDADTRVAPNWICRNLEEIKKGADAVGGRIVVLPCEQVSLEDSTRLLYRYDELYARLVSWVEDRWDPEAHDPWPRHHQHFGASLAITPGAYRRAGRLPPRRVLEDIALYHALLRRDLRIRHPNTVRVFTSARVKGRTRFGLSRQLNDWQERGRRVHRVRVESARFLKHLFRTRNQLRRLWTARRCETTLSPTLAQEVSRALGMPERGLVEAARMTPYFGLLLERITFYERCRTQWPDWVRLARLSDTVEELQSAFEGQQRRRAQLAQVLIGAQHALK